MAELHTLDFSGEFSGSAFDDPREVAYFSVDSMEIVHYDRSELRYYIPRSEDNIHLDLNAGHAEIGRVINYNYRLDLVRMLKYFQKTEFEALKSVDFVGFRSSFARICTSPSLTTHIRDRWIICASLLDGVIYLKEISTFKLNARGARLCAGDMNFPAYLTADSPDGSPDVSSWISDVEKFHILVKNKIGKHSVLVRCVVNAVEASGQKDPEDTSCYVEMKTCLRNDENCPFFKKKMLSWWAQSHITGIKKVVCGFKNENGIIHSIKEYSMEELVRCFETKWSSKACFSYCNEFLNFLKRTVTEDNHRIVYKIDFLGANRLSVEKLEHPEEKYRIIPDWYAEELKKKKQTSAQPSSKGLLNKLKHPEQDN